MSSTTDVIPAMSKLSLSPPTPTLLGIPRELRDRILSYVIKEPLRPNFEAEKPPFRYKNFAAVALVNRRLHAEFMVALKVAKSLVVVSSNATQFGILLDQYAVPFLTCRKVHHFQYHVARLHIRSPGVLASIKSQHVTHVQDLNEVGLLIRARSLELLHPKCLHEVDHIKSFPRVTLTIHFKEEPEFEQLSATEQDAILKSLSHANRAGKIKIFGTASSSVAAVLPGSKARFKVKPGVSADEIQLEKENWFRARCYKDGLYYIVVVRWIMSSAQRAYKARNHKLAVSRYMGAIVFFSAHCEQDISVGKCSMDMEPKLDTELFRAGAGLVRSLIELKDWELALHHMGAVLGELELRLWLPEEEVEEAKRMKAKIDAHFV